MQKQYISIRAANMPVSPIRRLLPFADEALKRGRKIYHLNIGDPDIKSPHVMIDTLRRWSTNPIPYSHSKGQKELLDALIWYYKTLGFPLTTDNIQISVGGSEAIVWAFLALCNPGDEVLVFEPFYGNYAAYATMCGIKLVAVTTTIENGFHLPTGADIEKKITAKTRAILICSPNNPTGTVYTHKEMERIVGIANKRQLFLLSDEVYREFAYDGGTQISALAFAKGDMKEKIVILDSLSKRYSLCGARLGAFISYNAQLMQIALKFGQARLSAGFIDQMVAAQLRHVPSSYFKSIIKEYEARRNLMYEGLNKIPGVFCARPEGAFYMMVRLPVADAGDFAKYLLTDFHDNNETIMVAPGDGFYGSALGKNEIRIAYVLNQQSLTRCLKLIALALQQYNQSLNQKLTG